MIKRTITFPNIFSLRRPYYYRNPLNKINVPNIHFFAPAAGQNRSVFSFARVYRAPLDKQKTMDFSPLRAHKKTFEAFTNGFLLIIWRVGGGLKTSPLPCLRPGWFYPNLLNPDSFTVRSIRWWKNIAAAGFYKETFSRWKFSLDLRWMARRRR